MGLPPCRCGPGRVPYGLVTSLRPQVPSDKVMFDEPHRSQILKGGAVFDVRRLRLLREVELRGTLSAVAEALHQSPSSVSQQLSQLEREVGVPLLQRTGRGVQLTPQAELLSARTATILDQLEQARTDLAVAEEAVIGTVDVAVFQSAALALMPRTLTLLAERHPRLRVTLTQHEPETALRGTWARDFDLVVAEEYPGHAAPHHPGLDRVPLTRDRIRLAVPRDAAFDPVTSLADAAGLSWVMEPYGAASRHFAEQTCRVAGFEPDVRFSTADLQTHLALVRSGNAVALVPELMLTADDPAVRLVDLAGEPTRSVFTAARTTSAQHPALVAVREVLAEVAGRRRG
ncbi:MAG: LysR family transcriptional regulator [Nocardioides sp.]|uniref:LysR family transcriptional regulator n=1 Tax=Nocardioides sp. TaxID=35761 RepID=UPI003F00E8E4